MNRTPLFSQAVLAVGVLCLGVTSAQSQSVYRVRAGATGIGDGSDWNNAYPSLPATLQRGATYYIGSGTYSGRVFNDAVSGTAVITIKKATTSDHGTDTGWKESYGGQAVFNSTLEFDTGYYVFDGQTRNESNWFDGTSYGIQVANNNQDENIILRGSGSIPASNITIRDVFVKAIHGTLPQTTIRRYAVDTETFDNSMLHTGLLFQRMYICGSNQHWYLRQSIGSIVEFCATKGIVSNSATVAKT